MICQRDKELIEAASARLLKARNIRDGMAMMNFSTDPDVARDQHYRYQLAKTELLAAEMALERLRVEVAARS